MNKNQIKIIEEQLGLNLDGEQLSRFQKWEELFFSYNEHTNLMSRNEEKNLFEKHIYDSLSIVLWDQFLEIIQNGAKLLDIGTGGGFPSVMLALAFSETEVVANDSRSRKTKFLELLKNEIGINNLKIITERAEYAAPQSADIVTFRAVGKIKDLLPLAKRHMAQRGYAVFYKAKGVKDEIYEALRIYKNLERPQIVPYKLPLDVEHVRNLVIFRL